MLKSIIVNMFTRCLDIEPLSPITSVAGSSNHTKMTRRINLQHPDVPYSNIAQNSGFIRSAFKVLGAPSGAAHFANGGISGESGNINIIRSIYGFLIKMELGNSR